jgi:iron complex transport system ATP-binding protein
LLQAVDLTFGYSGRPVLERVSLDVPSGAFAGIIGPNGSGKTTLLRLLAGTRRPQRGSVLLDGRPLGTFGRAAVARRMAVVPQETHLAFEYTVLEVVLMGRYPHLGAFQIEGPHDVDVAERALAATGTLHLEGRVFSTLSGGEKQRVVIAAALAQITSEQTAPVLLLDEPTAALDLRYQLEIAALLRTLHRDHALTVVLSTHDLNFAASVCESLLLLKEGRTVAAGPLADVLTRARVRELYDVEADVSRHPSTGNLTVVPLRTVPGTSPRTGDAERP